MDLSTFLRFARQYNNLGWAVREQLDNIASGGRMRDQNSNALVMIKDFLNEMAERVRGAEELAQDIDQYLTKPHLVD